MNKALFLDRDGVINLNHGYVHRKDNFDFIEGVTDLVARANKLGYLVIVVTNQSGIGRGMYTERDFSELTTWMVAKFNSHKARIDDVLFCPHHPEANVSAYKKVCECRKPSAGMLLEAADRHNLDLATSIMVGDKWSDVEASINAGLKEVVWFSQTFSDEHQVQQCKTKINSLAPSQTLISTSASLDTILN